METRMPSGELLREDFENMEAMMKRFGELSAKGGKVERMHVPNPSCRGGDVVRNEPFVDRSKYSAHQGKREVERRLNRLLTAKGA